MDVFHSGEVAAQRKAGFVLDGAPIRPFLTDQHRRFFAGLPVLFAAVADPAGWPVATALTGEPGFLTTPDEQSLQVGSCPALADPALPGLRAGAQIGLLGIDLGTRRRNRLNGVVTRVDGAGFTVSVRQSFGNCPQYIQLRRAAAAPAEIAPAEVLPGLDGAARGLIAAADTFFVASTDGGRGGEAGGLDMSHRGGLPGFVRVEGNVLTIPDYRGNRYFNTLGNLLVDGRAGLLFIDWQTGTLMQLQGRAEIIWDGDELAQSKGAERLWRLHVTNTVRRRGALPLRWVFEGYAPQLSDVSRRSQSAAASRSGCNAVPNPGASPG